MASVGSAPKFGTTGREIGETLVGATIAAYSWAMFFSLPLPSLLQRRFGSLGLMMLGIACNLFGNLAFGMLPMALLRHDNATAAADNARREAAALVEHISALAAQQSHSSPARIAQRLRVSAVAGDRSRTGLGAHAGAHPRFRFGCVLAKLPPVSL